MTKKDRAKSMPIQDFYPWPSLLKKFGTKLRGKCPFHDDKEDPNFFIYTPTNTFYCFRGCGGGDVITFVRRLKGFGFMETIDFILEGR